MTSTPVIWWLPLAAATLAFTLNMIQRIWDRTTTRWIVARAIHREAAAAAILLRGFHESFQAGISTRLASSEPLFFYSDDQEGSVFQVFADDLRHLPPQVATPALDYFESHAFLSNLLSKMEDARFDAVKDLERRQAIADMVAQTIEETAALARRTSEASATYLRGRFIPFVTGPGAARLAARIERPWRKEKMRWARSTGQRRGLGPAPWRSRGRHAA